MPRTLHWLGWQVVHVRPPPSHHWRLSVCPFVVPIFVHRRVGRRWHVAFVRGCCKLLVIQVLRNRSKGDVSHWGLWCQPNLTALERYDWEVTGRTAYGSTLASSDFQQLFGKWFVTDTDVKQAGTSCPQTLDNDTCSAGIQANVP